MVHPNTSTVVEQRLADYDVTPAIATVNLSDIDTTKSMHRQNRDFGRLDDDNVLQMAVALEIDPDRVLPRVVLARLANGRLVIVDGNHRVAAYKMTGRTTIDAYVIEGAAASVVESLTLEANTANGRPLLPDERLSLALAWADLNDDLRLAASRFGYRYDWLQMKRRVRAGQDKARRAAGVRVALPDTKAEALNRLDEDQIRVIGRALIESSESREIRASVANILAVPAAEQANQVQQEVGRLAQMQKAKRTPAGKARAKAAPLTTKTAVAQLTRMLREVQANPSWRTDAAFLAALDALSAGVNHRGNTVNPAA